MKTKLIRSINRFNEWLIYHIRHVDQSHKSFCFKRCVLGAEQNFEHCIPFNNIIHIYNALTHKPIESVDLITFHRSSIDLNANFRHHFDGRSIIYSIYFSI